MLDYHLTIDMTTQRRWTCFVSRDYDGVSPRRLAKRLRRRDDVAIAIHIDDDVKFVTVDSIENEAAASIVAAAMKIHYEEDDHPYVENVDRQTWDKEVLPLLAKVESKMHKKLELINRKRSAGNTPPRQLKRVRFS